jgi:hypothetical protein
MTLSRAFVVDKGSDFDKIYCGEITSELAIETETPDNCGRMSMFLYSYEYILNFPLPLPSKWCKI